MKTISIAVLSQKNYDLLPRFWKPILEQQGFEPNFYASGYNQGQIDLISEESSLYRIKPDWAICIFDADDLLYEILHSPYSYTDHSASLLIDQESARWIHILLTAKQRLPKTTFLFPLLMVPLNIPIPLLDGNQEIYIEGLIARFNLKIVQALHSVNGIYTWQWNHLQRMMHDTYWDPRMAYLGGIPMNHKGFEALASLVQRYIIASLGASKKCIVLDLDNTLWGGIVGQDGVQGIALGGSGLGRAFVDFQNALLQVSQLGVLLAVCSKNNAQDAFEVFEKHPDMVLKKEHIACWRVNWKDKPENIKEIAAELHIGLDSLVFFDDNPVEREMVQTMLPSVMVVNMPTDPAFYTQTLHQLECFDRLTLSVEDQDRSRMYQEQQQRQQWMQQATSKEDFLRSLQMEALIEPAHSITIPRIAQLTQKTNQFNVTTRRYIEADIEQFVASEQFQVFTLSLSDRFGNNGLVGVLILQDFIFQGKPAWKIDTFLLSCRVMGRTVEHAFLGWVRERAIEKGIHILIGEYLPTAKNESIKNLYKNFGFYWEASQNLWIISVDQPTLSIPTWFTIRTSADFNPIP